MSNDVKSRMKGFITEARSMKKEAKVIEEQAKEVKDKLKSLEEKVLIAQINQKNIDLEYDKVNNEYYAATSKKELLQQKLANADATQRAQAVKIASFGSEAEECNRKSAENEKKYEQQMEKMTGLRRGLKDAHALSVLADKENSLKQMEINAAKLDQHESLQRLREAEHELEKMEGDIIKYNKIGELWEAKCEQLEEELINTKKAVKHVKGLNQDSFEVTEELKEEVMFLQMNERRHEQRAEFAENIVDKLEQQCEKLNDQLFLENGKFMEMSEKLENRGNGQAQMTPQIQEPEIQEPEIQEPQIQEPQIQEPQIQEPEQIQENFGDENKTPVPEVEQQQTVQQDRLLAPSKMELPMSPAAKTPTQEFILEENEVPFETEDESRVLQSDMELEKFRMLNDGENTSEAVE